MVKADDKLFQSLVDKAREIYKDNLNAIILYGSVARGTATDESDIDIAFLVKTDDRALYKRLINIIGDMDLEYNIIISAVLIEKDQYDKWKDILPFYRNINNEGIRLWTAA